MKKINFYPILSALFVGGMALSAVSCADNNLDEELCHVLHSEHRPNKLS